MPKPDQPKPPKPATQPKPPETFRFRDWAAI